MRKKRKEDEQTLEALNSAHRLSQAKCQLIQTSYIKRIKFFLFLPHNKQLINRARSVCMEESWRWSCVKTSVKILPYRPPARLKELSISLYFEHTATHCLYGHPVFEFDKAQAICLITEITEDPSLMFSIVKVARDYCVPVSLLACSRGRWVDRPWEWGWGCQRC